MLLGLSWLHAQGLSGTYNITGNPNPGPGEFTTIQDAFNALMSQGVDPNGSGVTFVVQESWRTANSSTGRAAEPSTIQLGTYPGAGSRPVTLTFSGLADTVYFAKAPTNTGRFIFRFTGTIRNFTLDGAGKLILKSTTATGTSGTNTGLIGFVSTSTPLNIDAITIQNVVMHGSGRGTTYAGIYIGDDGTLGTAVSANSSIGTGQGVTIQGCTIDSVSRPILVAGRRDNTKNIRVIQDTLGNPRDRAAWAAADNIGAVHLRGVQSPIVQRCIVHGESGTNTSVAGIRLDSCENFTITQNWVYNIRYTGTLGYGSYGIFISLPSTFTGSPVNNVVSNNMLAGLSGDGDVFAFPRYIPAGIFVETTSGTISDAKLSLIHNSIHLFGSHGTNSTYTGGSAGIAIRAGVQGGVKIDGNLIQNTFDAAGNDAAYGLVIAAGSPSGRFDINYNQYYLAGNASRLVYARVGATEFPTFSGWQSSNITNIPSPDANGLVHLPGPVPFVNDTNLHLVAGAPSTAINAGNIAYRGAPDFDGETRPLPNPPGSSANNPPDPGTAPDVGADELDGTPFSCPSSLQAPDIVVVTTDPDYPPLAGTEFLWGQQVKIDTTGTNSPTPSGTLNLIYSLDNGNNWTTLAPVTSFPVIITLPPVAPPYRTTMLIAVEATAPGFCSLPPDRSDNPFPITVTDRLGNRADNAILITLTPDPLNPGHWIAPLIADSTSGPGLSNEYVDPTPGAFNDSRGRPTRDLFFRIDLPECLDSLDVSLCSTTSGLLNDTYLHLINATVQDTIDSDDGCLSGGNLRSEIRALGLPNVLRHNPTSNVNEKPARDTLLLVSGHVLYIVVEGYGSDGKFELRVKGYKIRPNSINVAGAPTRAVCINSDPITLDATTPGATAYQWLDANDNPIPGAINATYIVTPDAEGSTTVKAQAIFNDPNGAVCSPVVVASSAVTITVEDTARARIADADGEVISNSTLTINEGSDVTLNVDSPQTSDNSYTWKLYNGLSPSEDDDPIFTFTSPVGTITISNISAGSYTVILEAVRGSGACGPTRDTVYLNVTTGLRTDAGTFSIFPNPNTGAFTIAAPAMDTYRVQVLDVAGHLVAEDAFTGSTHQMRVSLPAGIYQVRLIAGEKVQVGRLVITQ
jgi:hypothetical protein